MKLEEITFITVAGGTQTLAVTNYKEEQKLEYWAEPDEALDGSLRQNVRGRRWYVEIDWEDCHEGDVLVDILNNIETDFANGLESIQVGIDLDNMRRVTFDSGFQSTMKYLQQYGVFQPIIRLASVDMIVDVTVGSNDYRFVNEAVTESFDYGLITEAVTESEDYALII